MNKRIYTLSLAFLMAGMSAMAQEEATPPAEAPVEKNAKNVIRTRPLRTAITVVSPVHPIMFYLGYERALGKKVSLGLNGAYGPKRDIALLDVIEVNGFKAPKVGGIMVNPEFRFYPGNKKAAPRGFYLSIDAVYSQYSANTDVDVPIVTLDIPITPAATYTYYQNYPIKGALTNMGGGIGIGTQWFAGKHVSFDLLWIGLGVTNSTLSLKVNGPLVDVDEINKSVLEQYGYSMGLTQEDAPTWESITSEFDAEISSGISEIPYFGNKFKIKAESDGVKVSLSSIAPRLRLFNFSMGIAF